MVAAVPAAELLPAVSVKAPAAIDTEPLLVPSGVKTAVYTVLLTLVTSPKVPPDTVALLLAKLVGASENVKVMVDVVELVAL